MPLNQSRGEATATEHKQQAGHDRGSLFSSSASAAAASRWEIRLSDIQAADNRVTHGGVMPGLPTACYLHHNLMYITTTLACGPLRTTAFAKRFVSRAFDLFPDGESQSERWFSRHCGVSVVDVNVSTSPESKARNDDGIATGQVLVNRAAEIRSVIDSGARWDLTVQRFGRQHGGEHIKVTAFFHQTFDILLALHAKHREPSCPPSEQFDVDRYMRDPM